MSFSVALVALLGLTALSNSAHAFSLEWSGLYRIEALRIKNSELESIERNKAYINHHLILRPRAVVADGLSVFSRFDILNNADLPNSQFGQFFGNGVGGAPNNSADNTNVLAGNQADETLRVTELYLTYHFEFATLIAGRAPLHFGLGLTHNSGSGQFDHWYDNRDLVAFAMVMGNLKFRPMFAKAVEGELDIGDDINEYMFQMDYENAETDTSFGLFYQSRRSGLSGNDIPAGLSASGIVGGFEGKNINFYMKRGWEDFSFGLEGGFAKGKTGLRDSSNNDIGFDGFGIAVELDYQKPQSLWHWNLKTGLAGGDNPDTANTLEGFFFDRNYEIGLLLFNHVVGQFDALSTSLVRDTTLDVAGANGFTNAGSVPDVESLSNVIYLAPGFTHKWKDEWSWGGRLIYAVLSETNLRVNGALTNVESDLGYELDFNLTYRPHERFTWVSEVGLLSPGAAFEGGATGLDSKFAYGIMTKAAINF